MNFTDKEKSCFKYFNGEVELFGDPLALRRKLNVSCGCDPAELWDRMEKSESLTEKWALQGKMWQAVREAFGMLPFDPLTGKGAQDEHCIKAWNDFWLWMDEKKNPQPSSQTPPPRSASSLSFGAATSITKPMSA
jgi:hypothetical protein